MNNATEVEAVLKTLRAGGKPGTAAIYRNHGVSGETFGTSYAVMNPLIKKLGTDHPLAQQLWATGIHDARIVALGIADPNSLSPEEIQGWLRALTDNPTIGALATLAARAPEAGTWARKWIDEKGEWVSSAGWSVIAGLANAGKLTAAEAKALLGRIEKELPGAKNRTRHTMNNALIAIGGAMPALTAAALSTAKKLGKVEVDHGATGCQTPDATAYIEKLSAKRKGKAKG